MNKNITILIVLLIVAAAGLYFWKNNQGLSLGGSNTEPTTIKDNNNHPVAKAGERCGGNMANAPVCGEGYACEPDPASHLPFGDVGGICVSVAAQGEFGQ